jgi:hypothetical protein
MDKKCFLHRDREAVAHVGKFDYCQECADCLSNTFKATLKPIKKGA